MLMVTANVPSAKKLIVHGPDLSSIPSQFPIHEVSKLLEYCVLFILVCVCVCVCVYVCVCVLLKVSQGITNN